MRHRYLVLFLLTLLLGPVLPGSAAAGGTVIFTKVLPKPGLIRSTTEDTSMRFTISADGKTLKMSSTGTKNKSEKLLVARGSSPTKLEVTYHKVTKAEVKNGVTGSVPSPIEGKTYVVEAKGGQISVSDTSGQLVPAQEQLLVKEDYRSLGKPNFMLDGLPATPIRIGARIPTMEEALKKSFTESMSGKPQEQWSISAPTVTLSGQGRVEGAKVAFLTFAMAMTMAQPSGFGMTMHMKGTVTLRLADGWPIRMTMKGPMDIMGTKNAGQMSMNQRTSYK